MSKPRYAVRKSGAIDGSVEILVVQDGSAYITATQVASLLNEREELEAEACRLMRNMLGAIEKPAWKTGVTIFEATRELISWLHEHDPIFSAETDKLVKQEADSEPPESESQS